MKLIIDIDEDYVKIINKNGASNYPEEVIKNGIPLDKMIEKIEAVKILRDIVNDDEPTVDVLDKIRAELMLIEGMEDALEIIDKYRGV